jgi:outer membrane protein assembly factor BamB
MINNLFLLIILIIIVSSTQAVALEVDELKVCNSSTVIWPMFCHDKHHTGRSTFLVDESPIVQWSYFTDMLYCYGSTAIGSDGTLYFNAGNLFAVNPDGTLKWIYPTTGFGECTPAIGDDGTIYFGTSCGYPAYFYAVNPDGTTNWKLDMIDGYCRSSPAIGNDETVYFGFQNVFYAINPNGTIRWTYPMTAMIHSSPAIGDDGTIYFGCLDTYFYALNPNGTLKWTFKTGYGIGVSPCIGDNGIIYFVSTDGYLYALYPSNGTKKWQTYVGAGTSPTISQDGTIYAGWETLHAVDSTDGTIKWKIPADGYIEGGTPCTSYDGTVFYGSTSGNLVAVNPEGTVKWKLPIGVTCQSAPAIGEDGTIYIGSWDADDIGRLNAIGTGEPKTIEVLTPKQGRLNVFGVGLTRTPLGNTVVIGPTTVKVKVSHEDELINVTFKIGNYVYSSTSNPPYEWFMFQRFTGKPWEHITLTVTGYYKGGCRWTVSIPMWHFSLIK